MRENRISSVLVRCDPPGIVTDRDLRNRVLAAGLGPAEPVTRVLSRPLQTVESATPTYEAWQRLLDSGVHHLPVTKDGEIVGVLTSSDLLRSTAQGPVAVLRRVEHLPSRDALPGYAGQVKEMTSALLAGGLDALVIAGFVSRLNDALVKRILRLGRGGAGPAAGALRLDRPRLGGAHGADPPHRPGQRHRLRRRGDGAPRLVPGAGRAGQPRPARGRLPASAPAATWPAAGSGPLSEWKQRFTGWIDVPNPAGAARGLDLLRLPLACTGGSTSPRSSR